MTSQTFPRGRFLKLRSIECQIAQNRLADAEKALHNLRQANERLRLLNAALEPQRGVQSGQSLKAMSEMAGRIGNAVQHIADPIVQAQTVRDARLAEQVIVRQHEQAAQKLFEKARATVLAEQDRRFDADRPDARRKTSLLGAP